MAGRDVGGGNPPPSGPLTRGDFLLQLLRRPPQSHQQMTTTTATVPAPIDAPRNLRYEDPAMGQGILPFSPPNFADVGRPHFHPPPWFSPHHAPPMPPPPHQNTAGISLPQFSPPPPGFAHSQRLPVDHQRGVFPRGTSETLLRGGSRQLGLRNEDLDVGGRGRNVSDWERQRNSIEFQQLGAGSSQGRVVGGSSVPEQDRRFMNGVGFGQFTHNETDRSHLNDGYYRRNDGGKMVLSSARGQLQHSAQRMVERRPHELQNLSKGSSGHKGQSNGPARRQNTNHGMANGLDISKKYARPRFGSYVPRENLQGQLNLDHEVNCAGDFPGNDRNPSSEPQVGKLEVKKEDGEGISREKQHAKENCVQVESFGSNTTLQEHNTLVRQLADSLTIVDEHAEKSKLKVRGSRSKDFRSDFSRGRYVSSQRVRLRRGSMDCRPDIRGLSPALLSIYKSLVPSEEEIAKQTQLLMSLKKLVKKEWPNADLHLYGSFANSFGVSNSDIDICLAIDDTETTKPDILLRLADILELNGFQNVQALTRARVPIVKLMDPVFSISCDICVNNLLAVVNTKLLRDYAHIDERLRQLAFLVKHWAKSREVNEAYQGTLSSYAYVLMCIHFLQQRRPPILPCLQEMGATYVVTVEGIKCAYFDKVEVLQNFGSKNKKCLAELLWGFFNYWAFQHDYTNNVISVRTGSIIRKQAKDWSRRIGNDRHLICIEDPFEISHDLGRVVDKRSIRILREEFERAANIMQEHRNPCTELFEHYVRESTEK